MIKRRLFILISAIISINLYADEYIITKDGDATWAVGTKQKGDSIVYTEKATGNEVTVSISKLDGVIPKVKRGKKYSEEYIQKQITKLKKLRAKHRKKLQRSVTQLLQEWEMLMNPSDEIENGIPKFENDFMASKKDTTDFKTAHMGLGMLKYKDMRGAYAKQIDDTIKRVQDEYIKVSMERLSTWSKNTKLKIDQFYVAKKLCDELVQYTDEATKTKAAGMLETSRANTTKSTTMVAGTHFAKNKNVDSYLQGYDMLREIRDKVAESEADKEAAAKNMEIYRGKVAKHLSAYSIDEQGFAIPKKDADLVTDFQKYGSMLFYTSDEFDQEVIFVPTENPGVIRINSMGTSIKFRMFFNRPQPKGRDYGVKVNVLGSPYSKSQVFTFTDPIEVTNGNATLNFRCQFDWLPSDFVAGDPETGSKSVSISCGYGSGDSGWKPRSNVCRFKAN